MSTNFSRGFVSGGIMKRKIKLFIDKYRSLEIVAKATLWFLICSFFQKGLSLISTPIFTRLMSTEEFGQFNIYNSWLQIFTLICTFRLDYGVFNKGMSKFSKERESYAVSMQSFTSIITMIVLVVYLIFRDVINEVTELSTFITVSMIVEVFFSASISFWTIKKRYEYKYKEVVFLTMIMSILNLLVGVVAVVVAEEKGVARILSCVLIHVLIGAIIYANMLYSAKGKKVLNVQYLKFAILFNIPLLPHYFSTYILEQADRIMIQKMIGLTEAGIYSVAYNVGMIMKLVSNSVNNSLVPWQYQKLENKEYEKLNQQMDRFMLLVSCVIIIFVAIAPEAVYILAGQKYYEARYCIPPVAVSYFFIFVWGLYGNAEFFFDANKFTMWLSLIGAVVNVALNYVFISLFGYISAAYTTLICYVLFTVAHYIYLNFITGKKIGCIVYKSRNLILYSAGIIAAMVLLICIYDLVIVRYVLLSILLIVAYIKRDRIKAVIEMK